MKIGQYITFESNCVNVQTRGGEDPYRRLLYNVVLSTNAKVNHSCLEKNCLSSYNLSQNKGIKTTTKYSFWCISFMGSLIREYLTVRVTCILRLNTVVHNYVVDWSLTPDKWIIFFCLTDHLNRLRLMGGVVTYKTWHFKGHSWDIRKLQRKVLSNFSMVAKNVMHWTWNHDHFHVQEETARKLTLFVVMRRIMFLFLACYRKKERFIFHIRTKSVQ